MTDQSRAEKAAAEKKVENPELPERKEAKIIEEKKEAVEKLEPEEGWDNESKKFFLNLLTEFVAIDYNRDFFGLKKILVNNSESSAVATLLQRFVNYFQGHKERRGATLHGQGESKLVALAIDVQNTFTGISSKYTEAMHAYLLQILIAITAHMHNLEISLPRDNSPPQIVNPILRLRKLGNPLVVSFRDQTDASQIRANIVAAAFIALQRYFKDLSNSCGSYPNAFRNPVRLINLITILIAHTDPTKEYLYGALNYYFFGKGASTSWEPSGNHHPLNPMFASELGVPEAIRGPKAETQAMLKEISEMVHPEADAKVARGQGVESDGKDKVVEIEMPEIKH